MKSEYYEQDFVCYLISAKFKQQRKIKKALHFCFFYIAGYALDNHSHVPHS